MYKFLILLTIVIIACNSSKVINATSVEQIKFGSGGGVTGIINEYTLNSNGKILNENQSEVAKVNRFELVDLFQEGKALLKYDLNSPQNMYYFIQINGVNDTNRLIWGIETRSKDERINKLYQKLNNKVN